MNERNVKILVILVSTILILLGYFSKDVGILANLLIISIFASFSTFAFFEYVHYRKWKEMEEKLPVFLRDLTETLGSGVTLPQAIRIVSKNDYGSLSSEIKLLANQLSWNIPIHKALDKFVERMRKNKRISTAFRILREAYISGGNTLAVLTTLSESLEMLQQMEKERKSILNQYTLMMYVISFIFLGVVVMITKVLLPIFASPHFIGIETSMGLFDPCLTCSGTVCNVCEFFSLLTQSVFGFKSRSPYYFSIFFFLSLIQAIFVGLAAGQISEGSIRVGLKHCLILASIIMASYLLLARIGLIGV
jgi:flagellar protein FlaJ